MELLKEISLYNKSVEDFATLLISTLGILGIAVKCFWPRDPREDAELHHGRIAALLPGMTAAIYFLLQSIRAGDSNTPWMMLVSQTVAVLSDNNCKIRYASSVNGAIMSAAYLVVLFRSDASIAQGLVTLSLLFGHLYIPRSPDQYLDGKLLDRQTTASILERISFTWAASSFDDKCDNLPVLPASVRAAAVAKRYAQRSDRNAPISKSFLRRFRGPIMIQWAIAIIQSAVSVVPRYLSYKLLEHLGTSSSNMSHGFYLAIALGSCKLLNTWLGSLSTWMTNSLLHYPLQTILMALVCDKSLRMPNVMSAESSNGKPARSIFAQMRIDGARASMVFTDSRTIPSIITRLIATMIFLNKLVGWEILTLTLVLTIALMCVDAGFTQKHHQLNAEMAEQRRENGVLLADALLAIRQIKLYATEDEWMKKISKGRNKELELRYRNTLENCTSKLINSMMSSVLAGVPLYLCALRGQPLTAAMAFTFLSSFQDLQSRLASLPFNLSYWVEGWDALQRLQGHFDASEALQTTQGASNEVSLQNARVAWNPDAQQKSQFELEASLHFPSGQLSVITGETASGKSLLLTAIAGEAALLSGDFNAPVPDEISLEKLYDPEHCNQEVAIVTQSPWMDNATIRDNITFGLAFEKTRYDMAIHCCALEKDLETLKDGDTTMIGTKGISVSGGQRWRIALARALYSKAEIILLDDILSAVDAEVREWLVDKALCGTLAQGRTRILATHHAAHCSQKAALTVTLENGIATEKTKLVPKIIQEAVVVEKAANTQESKEFQPKEERKKPTTLKPAASNPYSTYYKAIGGVWFAIFALATLALSTLLRYSRTRWLQKWTARYESLGKAENYAGSDAAYFGGIYLLISITSSIVAISTLYLSFYLGLRASRPMADAALMGVFHSPLQWLEQTSRGEITSRLGANIQDLDRKVPEDIVDALRGVMDLFIILFTSATVSGYEAIGTILLLFLYHKITQKLMPATKRLQKLSSGGTSALYQRLSDLQQHDALLTLRTFNMRGYFLNDVYTCIDDRIRYWWYTSLCKVMMDFQLEAVNVLFVTSIAVGAVATRADAGATGVALLFASNFSAVMSRLLRRLVDIEGDMVSVARVEEYANLSTEKMDGIEVPEDWPPKGALQVSNFTAGYEADFSSNVLKNLSFTVKPGERVGIVGRTGAGKSSLILALTRHLHTKGRIEIDGMDLETLRLKQLRQSLFVISQDPYLFGGTLRHVVDQAGVHADDEIQSVLSKIGFSTAPQGSASKEVDLSFGVHRGGLNLSQGQRQMLRLAQALLSRRRMVIMDEATSAIDSEADAAIQVALREILTETTLLVVAHRLATVADFDRLLVLEDGHMIESGPPAELYKSEGAFWKLVNASADKEELLKLFTL